MSTKTSLRFLVTAGAFLSANVAPAQSSFSTLQTLAASNTLETQSSGVDGLTIPDSTKVETPQADRNVRREDNKIINVFSSDLATLESDIKISATPSQAESEASVEIFVPQPLTRIIKVSPVTRLPRVFKTPTIPSVTAMPTMRTGTFSYPTSQPSAFVNNGLNEPTLELIYPLATPARITSRFGYRTHPLTGKRRFHSGIDIGAPSGAPVVAAGSGTIVSAGWNGGYGKAIVIQHNGIQQTLYGHLSEVSVSAGQVVEKGTIIGLVGSTGNSSGPHLHFESRMSTADRWVAVDPSEDIQYAVDNLRRSMPFARKDLPQGL
jgi:murein DD-endopeptidase MepM/ murein hydrolase activator NlpD